MISVPVKATLPYASQINHKTMITVLEFQMIQTSQEQEHLGIWQRSNMWFFLIIIISFTIVISLKAMDNGHLRQRLKHVFCIIPTPKTQVHLCELTVSHGWKLPHYHPSIIIKYHYCRHHQHEKFLTSENQSSLLSSLSSVPLPQNRQRGRDIIEKSGHDMTSGNP